MVVCKIDGSIVVCRVDWIYHRTADSNEIRLVRSGIVSEQHRARVSVQPLANLQITKAEIADAGGYNVKDLQGLEKKKLMAELGPMKGIVVVAFDTRVNMLFHFVWMLLG